ncbi:MAG: apolipoprotein N-acyltransferase [Methylocella sp.]
MIISATGWRRRLIAFAAGAVGALTQAPYNFLPAMVIPMTVAIWLIDGSAEPNRKAVAPRASWRNWRSWSPWLGLPPAARRAFAVGWWWGFGYFVAGLWWIGSAFLVEADEFAWALPLGVLGLPAALALYQGLGFMLARLIWTRGPSRIFAFAAALSFTEWLRGHLLTGFPINVFGMALGDNLVTAQLASLVGLYGLTVLAIALFAAPATLSIKPLSWRAWMPTLMALLALAAISGFGALRLHQAKDDAVPGIALRIMQPNLGQDDKFSPEYRNAILAHYLSLSALDPDPDSTDETVLIWPESAFPFILSRDAEALAQIGAALPLGSVLVTGAARAEESLATLFKSFGLPSSQLVRPKYFNSVQVIDSSGIIIDTYDKVHLVPFGEYLPLQSILQRFGLHHFVHVPGGFEAGLKRKMLTVPGLPPVATLICYEAIFPGEVLPEDGGGVRPGLLLNVTNDGWFGLTAGPYQHFAQSRLRAIEEGLPLIRAANTGISAIVDPYGRILAQLPLGVEGVLNGPLPQRIAEPLFSQFPFASPFMLWLATLCLALAGRARV